MSKKLHISAPLLLAVLTAISCTSLPYDKIKPAQLWRDAGPKLDNRDLLRNHRIEGRELLGTFRMEDRSTCTLTLNDGTVTRRTDNYLRNRCYGDLFQTYVSTTTDVASYAWGDITVELVENRAMSPKAVSTWFKEGLARVRR